jgi:hypothetical protein
MVGILISMLMVLIIYQVYLVSEGQKRTVTAGSDAQQNASYGLFLIGQDLMGAGQVISSSTAALAGCAMLRPIPRSSRRARPTTIPIRSRSSTAARRRCRHRRRSWQRIGRQARRRERTSSRGPLAFSPNDVVVGRTGSQLHAVDDQRRGVLRRRPDRHRDDLTHTLTATPGNNTTATYGAVAASLVNLGQAATPGEAARFGQTVYTVDRRPTRCARRACCPRCSR